MAAASREPRRLLILGGTGEAAALARRLADDPRLDVTTSLAGRTRDPAALTGAVRVGGFGGPEGLADYLRQAAIDLLIDASHPYAAAISRHAADACSATGVPRLQLVRPAWQPQAGDDWREVPDMAAAAATVPGLGHRVFLTVGRQELAAFAGLAETWFLVRSIEPPAACPLPAYEAILGRGPFDTDEEAALLRDRAIDLLVSKNSGGEATYPKIAAARRLGLPVVMVARPDAPAGRRVANVDDAAIWVEERLI